MKSKSKQRLNRGRVHVIRRPQRPTWSMKLSWPGRPAVLRSTEYLLCLECLADPAPKQNRPRCSCRAGAEKAAAQWLDDERAVADEMLRTGARSRNPAEELRLRTRHDFPTWNECLSHYEANVSPSLRESGTARANVNAVLLVLSQCHDCSRERARELRCDQPAPALLRKWMRLRQAEAAGAGSNWTELHRRAALPAEDPQALPALETHRPVAGNTTINSMLANAASILGERNRKALFADWNLPPVNPFAQVEHLPTLVGNAGRSASDKQALHAEVQTWPGMDPQSEAWLALWTVRKTPLQTITPPADVGREAWLAYWLLLTTGLRPVEMRAVRRSWLVQRGGGWWLHVTHRPDEGFYLKAGTKAKAKLLSLAELPDDALQILLERTGHVIAPDWTETQRDDLTKRFMSQRFKVYLPDAHAPVYELRKWFLTAQNREHGIEAASAAGGHSNTTTTAKHYTAALPSKPVGIGALLTDDTLE